MNPTSAPRRKWHKKQFNEFVAYLIDHNMERPTGRTNEEMGMFMLDARNRKNFWTFLDTRDKAKDTYKYLVTFTLKPDAVEDADKAELYIHSQADREMLKICAMSYVKELTKAGVPHFHAVIETSKPLKRNRFQYYEKLFGHVDISRTKGQTTQEALNYISKENHPIKLK